MKSAIEHFARCFQCKTPYEVYPGEQVRCSCGYTFTYCYINTLRKETKIHEKNSNRNTI